MIMPEVESSDAINKFKAKIQKEELSCKRLNILRQLAMSRPKIRNYHVRG